MKFKRRLRFYLIGFGIGIILSFFILNGRGCEWLPNNRVLNYLKSSKILVSPKVKCQMECMDVSSGDIYYLLENGDVEFGNSNTSEYPKVYQISSDKKDGDGEFTVRFHAEMKDSTTILAEVLGANNCDCDTLSEEELTVLWMPEDLVRERLLENEFAIGRDTKCYFDCFNLTVKDVEDMINEGEILFKESYPRRSPNPLYTFTYDVKGYHLKWLIEQSHTKTRILKLTSEDMVKMQACGCE